MGRKKKATAWRAVFLRVLERTGNVRFSAAEAGVDFTTAYNHRKKDPAFAGEWERALPQVGRALLDHARDEQREELVVRTSKAGTQIVKAASGRWSARAEMLFLGALADHGNIRRAAEAAGVSTQAVYARRQTYPDFREKWAAAKECGGERIDLLLIEAASRALDPEGFDFDVPEDVPRATIAEAIAIARLHKASAEGKLNGGRRPVRKAFCAGADRRF